MPSYPRITSPTSPPNNRFRDHSPTKSSPLRHLLSTGIHDVEVEVPTIPSRLESPHTPIQTQLPRSKYDSSSTDPFVTRTGTKRERSESPVKKNAAFAKWEQREQAEQAENVRSPTKVGDRPERMDMSPTKVKDDDWRSGIGRSESRGALKPVAANTRNAPNSPTGGYGERSSSYKENTAFQSYPSPKQEISAHPPPQPYSHSRGISLDSSIKPSWEASPTNTSPSSPTKHSMATLSRSDSMRASTRPRQNGHARFASTDTSIPQLDGEDIAALQKSSTPQMRHLSKLASESGTENLAVHSAEEQVVGLSGRRKLQRSGSFRATNKTQSQFASQYSSTKWMDTQRKHLQAYEYLCHIGEARAWLQDVLTPDELPPIVQLDEALRDGVTLAEMVVRLAPKLPIDQQRALGSQRIFRNPKLQFRHSDNIALFFRFLAEIELPELFRFELVDLYEKKNVPKVIYCIHALSWLLLRKGIVDFRIGNLLGKLQFEDHELEETQRGIDRSGIQMPNFGGMKEAMQVVEEEPEPTPEELLDEQRDVIIDLQSQIRGAMARLRLGNLMQDLWDAEENIAQFQALVRGGFQREIFDFKYKMQLSTMQFQGAAKAFLVRRQQQQKKRAWKDNKQAVIKVQSLWRGRQQRAATTQIKKQLQIQKHGLKELQAAIRGALGRWKAGDIWQETREASPEVEAFQAAARGSLVRMRIAATLNALWNVETPVTRLQALLRADRAKKAIDAQKCQLVAQNSDNARYQAIIRGHLCRVQTERLQTDLKSHNESVLHLQSFSRAMLQRRNIGVKLAALEDEEHNITSLQSLTRAYLERQRIFEQLVAMEKHETSITQLQALSRAMLARSTVGILLVQLEDHEEAVALLQAACRAFVVRSAFARKRKHFRDNMQKVIKLQSFVRAKQQGESYKSLVSGKNPPLPVVRRHLHLLTDSNLEFEGELEAERLRRQVLESVRRNELVEGYVEGIDVKIALLVKNKITLDEVVKHQKHFGGSASQLLRSGSTLNSYGNGFNLKALNKSSRRKLSGYEELFFILQTQPAYLSRLFSHLNAKGLSEQESKNTERLMLTLFGYAQQGREEYFLLKLLAMSMQDTLTRTKNLDDCPRLLNGSFHQRLLVHHMRSPRDRSYLKILLGGMVKEGICAQDHLDLESDPLQIYRSILNNEELSTGRTSTRPRDLPREIAIREHDVRPTYVKHLQDLRDLCDSFFIQLEECLHRMPYSVRFMATEQYRSLSNRFPRDEPAHLAMIAGSWLWKTYLLPALREPEMWGVIDRGLSPLHKRNLGQVITVLGQVIAGRLFSAENLYLQPLNNWVSESLERWQETLHRLFDISSPEEHFDADQYSDLYSRTKPVLYLKLSDIFALHSLIVDNLSSVAPASDDGIKELLIDLGTAKGNENDLSGAAQKGSEITLTLKSRFTLQEDPNAEARALFTATKRLVLYIIKVQSGSNLMEILTRPISHEDDDNWIRLISEEQAEKERESRRTRRHNMNPVASLRGQRALSTYSETFSEERRDLLDLEGMTYAELKSSALENILALEQPSTPPQYRVSRHNNYQELLNALAADIRQKHRRRLERQQEVESTRATLAQLDSKAMFLEDQLKSYNDYIEQCLHTLANKKGTKHKFIMPFTKQWSHERELERTGRQPKFGSYKYSARQLADKGVLLSWAGYAPDYWGQLNIVISSDEVGIFHLEASSGSMMLPGANANLLLDHLLQAQYDNKSSINVFDEGENGNGGAQLAVNLLLHLVFKKFYRDD
ncbi:Hypothetical protein R9X50_00628500 [Acrodontium crateriforme]|uniref:Uncharacterized protein n=1 Tax=Acrodontium crateriforme TaxID=150365 RepID=A0AAQ3RC30_9PEZI|nr:Hypothetical protein R9X50_00628500 [Acrodontium crateriforme]